MSDPITRFRERRRQMEERRKDPYHFQDEYGSTQCPVVHYFLAGHKDDGRDRELGKLILFAEDGRLKCCLKDADNGQVCFVTISSMETIWQELEAVLTDSRADWRDSNARGRK